MELREHEVELFEIWKSTRPNLVRDGVVDPHSYLQSDKRVLIILKEVNDEGGGNWDLRKFLRDGARSATWDVVTRWVKGIRNIKSEIKWDKLKSVNEDERKHILSSIAVMNLKKSPGSSSTNMKEISSVAKEDAKLINMQYNIYEPDIVILGGTGPIVEEIIESHGKESLSQTKRGFNYKIGRQGERIYHFYHPQARYPATFKHYMLMDAIREVEGISPY